jgi:hypothetical protein
LARFELESGIVSFCLKNRVCLSRGVQVAGTTWRATTRIMVGLGDLVQRTRDGHTCQILGGLTIERSGGAKCGLYHACRDKESGFLG